MKCIEKIYRKEGCARNGNFGVPKSIYRAQKKKNKVLENHSEKLKGVWSES